MLASGGLKKLQNLSLVRSGIGDRGICELCRGLSSEAMRSSLEEINLMGNLLTDKGLRALAQAVAPMEKLTSLQLHSCKKITERGLEALREVVASGGAPSLIFIAVPVESASLRSACEDRNIRLDIH